MPSEQHIEQYILRASIFVTLFLAILGIGIGLLAKSQTIIFDGIYETIDLLMTTLALLVARLIAMSTMGGDAANNRLTERFTMGFWHLEPMVVGLNAILLMATASYAFINAIGSILSGGRIINFDYALTYALISLVIEIFFAIYITRANRKIGSAFLAIAAKSWILSVGITTAYLIAFTFGMCAQGTELQWLVPYIDPIALAVVCAIAIPMPVAEIKRALADVFLITPADLKLHVDSVAQSMVIHYGFAGYRAYIARVGRGRQIELYFIVSKEWPAKRLEEWDQIRAQIGRALGDDDDNNLWLTIVFTTDVDWAD